MYVIKNLSASLKSLTIEALVLISSVCILTIFMSVYTSSVKADPIFKKNINNLDYIESPIDSLNINDIRKAKDWIPSSSDVFNMGYSNSAWWTRFRFTNPSSDSQYILQIAYAVLDEVDVYIDFENKDSTHYSMGDSLAFSSRPIKHRLFNVPFDLKAGESVQFYIRVKSGSAIQLPLAILKQSDFWEADITSSLIHGIYIGGLLCIAFYNLLIYFALRDVTYLYYVSYVASMFLFLLSLNGWAFQFLWPTYTWWNDQVILASLNGVVFFGVSFIRRFLSLSEHGGINNLISKVWIGLSGIGFLFFILVPYDLGIRTIIPYAAAICGWCIFAGINAWKKGLPSAGLYLVAWSGMLVGGIILAFSKFHILPRNNFTDYATQMGVLVEVLLLSFALAERINIERSLRTKAQQLALDTKTKATEQLEKAVADRTLELEEANSKLQELSDTDQLTQLKNRRYLDNYITGEFIRAERYGHALSILLIDIDHFKSVNDEHGHMVGDICLQQVAKRLSSQVRWPSDLTARYGGEEFCVVLPETPLDGAQIVSERILKRVSESPIDFIEGSLGITVSIGVATYIPESNEGSASVLKRADDSLYLAKSNGRNRVELSKL